MSKRRGPIVLFTVIAMLALCPSALALTISPLPGTPTASRFTQISFLGAAPGSLSGISVRGSRSGRHAGHLRPYASATGISLLLSKPFLPGEHVNVRATWSVGSRHRPVSTHFKVAVAVPPPNLSFPITPGTPADVQGFESEPSLHPPAVIVHQPPLAGSAPGLLFAAPFIGPGQYGPMIFDNAGHLVWFHQVPGGEDAADFRTQQFGGKTVLTWWEGKTIILGYGIGKGVIADASYKPIAVVKAGNGLATDEHEFTLLPNGSALLLAYNPVQQNLSSAGGPAAGTAVDCAVQVVDVHTGLVMWEWHSIGHVPLADSYSKPPTSASGYYDYFHVNSAQVLREGNILISARNTWGIYKLDMHSGRILWQLGGKRSSFALGSGVPFAYQHNALLLPNGQLSLFDDEGLPTVKAPSRGELLTLDMKTRSATLASQFVRAPTPVVTGSQGNLQQLPGGGWLVGWGGLPNFTEFNAAGQVVYDAQFPKGENSYRVYREPWTGQPSTPPALVVKSRNVTPPCPPGAACPLLVSQQTTAYASWNGATDVASWQLLVGAGASTLAPVATVPRNGFETAISAPPGGYFQVRALSSSGHVLGTSAAVVAKTG